MATNILMPALSPTTSLVMALLDRAIQRARVCERERLWIPAFAGMTKGDL